MYRALLLICALFFLCGGQLATAARPSAYARAKLKGRIYVHRPNYKTYHGRQRQHRTWAGRVLSRRKYTAHPSRSRI